MNKSGKHSVLYRLIRGFLILVGSFVALIIIAFLIYFPGRQATMALTLATGIGVQGLQERVDEMESKAIEGETFTDEDKRFLKNLYTCFAKGGRLTIILRQSAALMDRYLSCSGETLYTEPRIFLGSSKVQEQMAILKQQIELDRSEGKEILEEYKSEVFHMGDPAFPDSLVGLYYGHICVKPEIDNEGGLILHWRAEVPWEWPTYESLNEQYGDYHAQCFPLPNAMCLIKGPDACLRIDDGLGEYLTRLGLAKSFLAYSEWDEEAINEIN